MTQNRYPWDSKNDYPAGPLSPHVTYRDRSPGNDPNNDCNRKSRDSYSFRVGPLTPNITDNRRQRTNDEDHLSRSKYVGNPVLNLPNVTTRNNRVLRSRTKRPHVFIRLKSARPPEYLGFFDPNIQYSFGTSATVRNKGDRQTKCKNELLTKTRVGSGYFGRVKSKKLHSSGRTMKNANNIPGRSKNKVTYRPNFDGQSKNLELDDPTYQFPQSAFMNLPDKYGFPCRLNDWTPIARAKPGKDFEAKNFDQRFPWVTTRHDSILPSGSRVQPTYQYDKYINQPKYFRPNAVTPHPPNVTVRSGKGLSYDPRGKAYKHSLGANNPGDWAPSELFAQDSQDTQDFQDSAYKSDVLNAGVHRSSRGLKNAWSQDHTMSSDNADDSARELDVLNTGFRQSSPDHTMVSDYADDSTCELDVLNTGFRRSSKGLRKTRPPDISTDSADDSTRELDVLNTGFLDVSGNSRKVRSPDHTMSTDNVEDSQCELDVLNTGFRGSSRFSNEAYSPNETEDAQNTDDSAYKLETSDMVLQDSGNFSEACSPDLTMGPGVQPSTMRNVTTRQFKPIRAQEGFSPNSGTSHGQHLSYYKNTSHRPTGSKFGCCEDIRTSTSFKPTLRTASSGACFQKPKLPKRLAKKSSSKHFSVPSPPSGNVNFQCKPCVVDDICDNQPVNLKPSPGGMTCSLKSPNEQKDESTLDKFKKFYQKYLPSPQDAGNVCGHGNSAISPKLPRSNVSKDSRMTELWKLWDVYTYERWERVEMWDQHKETQWRTLVLGRLDSLITQSERGIGRMVEDALGAIYAPNGECCGYKMLYSLMKRNEDLNLFPQLITLNDDQFLKTVVALNTFYFEDSDKKKLHLHDPAPNELEKTMMKMTLRILDPDTKILEVVRKCWDLLLDWHATKMAPGSGSGSPRNRNSC